VWLDGRYSRGLDERGLLSVGVNAHREEMRSESDALQALQAEDPSVTGDSFDYAMQGIYAQADVPWGESLELSLAGRFDRITADYVDRPGGDEIARSLFSPRALLKWRHGDHLVSRISAGRGYRAPLSFFESDHGLLDAGYEVAVDDLERSLSFGYALSYERADLAVTGSANTTAVENLGFIDFDGLRPVLRNSDRTVRVDTFDLEFSRSLGEHWTLGGGGEVFQYDRAYRATFAIPPIEERLRLFVDYAGHGWSGFVQASWVGSRDLERYDTADRFNVLSPDGTLSDPKVRRAPAFVTLDARIERAHGRTWAVYLGANNLTGYNQAEDEENPLYFDDDGGYDVVHIFGPLRGRVVYAGIKAAW
jgi:outer membrane receptor protein involved in Fe transport